MGRAVFSRPINCANAPVLNILSGVLFQLLPLCLLCGLSCTSHTMSFSASPDTRPCVSLATSAKSLGGTFPIENKEDLPIKSFLWAVWYTMLQV